MTTPKTVSLAESIALLPEPQRKRVLRDLTKEDAERLLWDWEFWARPSQRLPPRTALPTGPWFCWVISAGRGWGKTRTGAETVRIWVKDNPYVNLIGATADDARDIMVEGESGILNICPPDEVPRYVKMTRSLEWPNGAKSLIFTADEPDRLRGKQHMKLWADEIASWRYPQSWDEAMLGLRLGASPQAIVTTTPKPIGIVKTLLADRRNVVFRGTTYENRANLSPGFFNYVITKYEGTRLGRQELEAEILDDVLGALWKRDDIDSLRVQAPPGLARVVVAIDPAVTSAEESSETGIIIAGLAVNGHGYVLGDVTIQSTPHGWASQAVMSYHGHQAGLIVGEVNNGGEMVGYTLATVDPTIPFKAVRASRGKLTRAEPIAALYQQKRIHHVNAFPELEDQMCTWIPGEKSPDRMDALVWAFTELFLEPPEPPKDQMVAYHEPVRISSY